MLYIVFMQHAILIVTLEPGDVLAEERMNVVISMVKMVNVYKHVIMWKMTSSVEVYRIRAVECLYHCDIILVVPQVTGVLIVLTMASKDNNIKSIKVYEIYSLCRDGADMPIKPT